MASVTIPKSGDTCANTARSTMKTYFAYSVYSVSLPKSGPGPPVSSLTPLHTCHPWSKVKRVFEIENHYTSVDSLVFTPLQGFPRPESLWSMFRYVRETK